VRASQYTCRQKDDRLEKLKHPIDCNADKPEWKQQQPDNGINDQRYQREGPAEEKEQKPENKRDHRRVADVG
jgi:hypothetical protein